MTLPDGYCILFFGFGVNLDRLTRGNRAFGFDPIWREQVAAHLLIVSSRAFQVAKTNSLHCAVAQGTQEDKSRRHALIIANRSQKRG